MPLVDIALPVYNGARFITQTLEGLLEQSVRDLRITVVDNASTDGTADAADVVATREPRVRVFRRTHNAGSIDNFNYAMRLTDAPYVLWASDHDVREPDYLERCLTVLEAQPDVVLCYTGADWVGTDGQYLHDVHSVIDTRGLPPLGRLNVLLWGAGPYCYAIYGLMRRSAVEQLRSWPQPYPDVIAPDIVMLSELAMVGDFAFVPEKLFHLRRMHDYDDFDAYTQKLGKRANSDSEALRLYARFLREMVAGVGPHAHSFPQALAGRTSALTCGVINYRGLFSLLRDQAHAR